MPPDPVREPESPRRPGARAPRDPRRRTAQSAKARRRPKRPDDAVARKASRQLGLVTLWQALEAGLTDDQVRLRIASGRWRVVQRGVYLINGVPDSWKIRLMAACLAAGAGRDGAVVAASHAAAAVLHGLEGAERPDRLDIVVPANRQPRVTGVRLRRSRELPEGDVTTIDGIPVTTGERTVLDLAGEDASPTTVTQLVDKALCAKIARRDRLHQRARDLRRGRAGAELVRSLTAPDGKTRFRSWLESHSAEVFRAGGLPEAEWNAVLRDNRGRIGEVDVVWRDARVVVELDGLRFHSTPTQRRRDARRDRRLTLAGWAVLRYTWHDIVERPDEVLAEIASALGISVS